MIIAEKVQETVGDQASQLRFRGVVETGSLLARAVMLGQRALDYGPSNPSFLLEPGELRGLFPGLTVEDYEECSTAGPRPDEVARLRARKPKRTAPHARKPLAPHVRE